jgi:hypothetical protein
MAGAKIVVLYPSPRDVNAFERAYTQNHVPMVTAELQGNPEIRRVESRRDG